VAKCSRAPGINEGHSLQMNSFGYWYCEYGCGYKKKAAKAEPSPMIEIKGGKWGNKSRADHVKSGSGCAVATIGLLGGSLAALYAAADAIWSLVA
jgi:hypothetical protein